MNEDVTEVNNELKKLTTFAGAAPFELNGINIIYALQNLITRQPKKHEELCQDLLKEMKEIT